MKNIKPTYTRNHSFGDRKITENVYVTDRIGNAINIGDEVISIRNIDNNRCKHYVSHRIPDPKINRPSVYLYYMLFSANQTTCGNLSEYPINICHTFWVKNKNFSIFERIRMAMINRSYSVLNTIINIFEKTRSNVIQGW
jgi:hypothetical protein